MKELCALLLFALVPGNAAAGDRNDDLAGTYKTLGDCVEVSESGEYEECEMWNTLELSAKGSNEYTYNLSTHTFATTPGGCESSGALEVQQIGDRLMLHGDDENETSCHLVFEVDDNQIELIEPTSHENRCQRLCGMNSSLYSQPFPRKPAVTEP